MIMDSKKYSKYLINKPDEIAIDPNDTGKVLRDEQSKTGVIYIHNPEKPTRPARIIALGMDNPGTFLSRKRVKHMHVSDPTAAEGDYQEAMDNMFTRLANTDGTAVIETIPGDPFGPIYDMWSKYRAVEWKQGYFKVVEVTADQAVKAGVILQSFLDSEKERLGARYPKFYGAQFLAISGNVFKTEDIERAIELGKKYDPDKILPGAYKSQGIDEGFGSSQFGVCVVQQVDNVLQFVMADEHEAPDIETEAFDASQRIKTWPIQTTQCDGAQPAFIRRLKRHIGEEPHYERMDKDSHKWMKVKPIPFSTTHKDMLGNMVILMEKGKLAIHPKFDKLIMALRTAVASDYSLDKEVTKHNDVLDGARLCLKPWSVGTR